MSGFGPSVGYIPVDDYRDEHRLTMGDVVATAQARAVTDAMERFSDALVALSNGPRYKTEESRCAMERILRKLARKPWTIREYHRRGKGKRK